MNEILLDFHYLLNYPNNDFFNHFNSLFIHLSPIQDEDLEKIIFEIRTMISNYQIDDLEEIYSQTFDWNTTNSLYLGYYLFGETYLRSNFLSKLLDIYKKFNYAPSISDLPDHLSILLEFSSKCLNGKELNDFIEEIILQGLNKINNLSKNQNANEKSNFTDKNPYYLILRLLLVFLTDLTPNNIILTTT